MLVIAHRGASAAFSENTLAAFAGAIAQGADGVELDVRRTADGRLALSHDDTLADGRVVVETPVRRPARRRSPTSPAALDVCAPLGVVNIEIKNWPDDKDFDPTEQLADGGGRAARGPRRARRRAQPHLLLPPPDRRPRARAGARPGHGLAARARSRTRRADRHGRRPRARRRPPAPRLRGRGRSSTAAHAAGLAVNTWTCDDPDRIRWLADLGVDAVVTNVPDIALAARLRPLGADDAQPA